MTKVILDKSEFDIVLMDLFVTNNILDKIFIVYNNFCNKVILQNNIT